MPATYVWTGTTNGTWNTTTNWNPNGTPGAGDSIEFNGQSTQSLTTSPSGNPVLATVRIRHSCPNSVYIGTPDSPIAAACANFIVGEDNTDGSSGSGSQQIVWNFGASQTGYSGTVMRILKTNGSGINGREVVQLKGTHTSNKLYVEGPGNVGMGAMFPGTAYTLAQANITGNGARVSLGSGGTLTTVYQTAGTGILNCAITTLNQVGGQLTTEGSGAITTANVGGIFIGNSTGTITTLNVYGSGFGDFTKSSVLRTVTNSSISGGGKLDFENGQPKSVTTTNATTIGFGAKSSQVNYGGSLSIQQS